MSTLKNEIDPQRLKMNVIEYFNGFSEDVQDIIDKFKLRQQVDNLTEVGRLGSLLEKFTDGNINLSVNPVMEETTDENGNAVMVERLPGLDNHTMGTIFEELLRKFNEENNVNILRLATTFACWQTLLSCLLRISWPITLTIFMMVLVVQVVFLLLLKKR